MIAVSIQYHTLGKICHLALAPIPTTDFDLAREYAKLWMEKNIPFAYNVTFSLVRDDWLFENDICYSVPQMYSMN